MKFLVCLVPLALPLAGCTSGACDTGDSACKAGSTTSDILIQDIYYDWPDTAPTLTWYVETSGETGKVELDIAETGDTSGNCVSNPNCSDEGFWTEYHNSFDLQSTTDGWETKAITLAVVSTYEEYVQNNTTILDMAILEIEQQTTFMVNIYDSSDNWIDCLKGGHDPGYYSECPNVGS